GDPERDELIGTTLRGTYSIVRAIGEGGMGRVYEARHTRIGSKRFAIKMLHSEYVRQAEVISRFQREAEAAAAIQSPYVVGVYDVDRLPDGRPYMVGEYLEGKEFAEYLTEVRKMPVGAAVRIVRQICKALEAAHAKNVVHRDMKPENVFLTGDLASPTAKVIDFGISKYGDSPGTALTKTGMIMGTPSYMAPEQARGARVDHRADIYAVGAILYCALTGQRPFDRGDPTATLTAVLTEDPPRPRSIEPSIPEPLEMVIQRAMSKMPQDRYGSMADLDAELARYDAGEAEPILPMQTGGRPTPGAAKITAFRVSSQDRQAREVSVARPSILLLSVLGILWAMGIAMTMAGAVLRITLRNQNLESSESVLLALLAAFAALAPVLLAIRHVRRTIWDNTSKAMDLAETLRRPVVAGLGAYGFASLLVRLMEEIVLRHATGVAWPKWDLLLGGIGVVAAVVAHHLPDLEKKNASQVK
ncbi:MAG TPA: serine/threonine-protein kinase, partial [Polyangiaceae bacterium]